MISRANAFGEARPVRRLPSSSQATRIALSIFSSTSKSVSSITAAFSLSGEGSAHAVHERADLLTARGPGNVAVGELEDDDGHRVVAAEAECGGVGDVEAPLDHLVIADRVELDRLGMRVRVGVVHTVDAELGEQKNLAPDLESALRGDRVGGEVRQPGARAEDDHASLLEVPLGPPRYVGLGDLAHRDRRLDPGRDAGLLQEVL